MKNIGEMGVGVGRSKHLRPHGGLGTLVLWLFGTAFNSDDVGAGMLGIAGVSGAVYRCFGVRCKVFVWEGGAPPFECNSDVVGWGCGFGLGF